MSKVYLRNQKGAISYFVMMAMLFFLFVILGVYSITSKRAQTQTQSLEMAKEQYYTEDAELMYKEKTDTAGEVIPIYTKEQLLSVGSGKKIEIEGKVYVFSDDVNYELKNDILLEIGEEFSKINYDLVFGSGKKVTGEYKILGYYDNTTGENNGKYYVPVEYSGTQIYAGEEAVLSLSGKNVSETTTGLSGSYYLFALNKSMSETLGYVTDGLVLHWDAKENTVLGHNFSTTKWFDLSGNGNHGTLDGFTFDGNNGWEDNSLYINGANKVFATNADLTNFTIQDFTISTTFINKYDVTEETSQPLLVSNGWWKSYGYYLQFRTDNQMSINVNQSGTSQGLFTLANSIPEEQKYEVTFVRSGTNMKVYINGEYNTETNSITSPVESSMAYTVNANANWIGNLMSTRVYNKALTEDEVRQNYEIDKSRFGI